MEGINTRLQGEIKIRKYDTKDISCHYQAVVSSIERLQKWFSFAKADYSINDSEEFIIQRIPNDEINHKQYHFAIVNTNDDFLGSCSLKINCADKKVATMNYWVREGKSKVGKYAAKLLRDMGFLKLGLREIHIDIADCNLASINIAKSMDATVKNNKVIRTYDGSPPELGKRYAIDKSSLA